ncbi:hypothetical protein PIB30_023736, partial [Stylosanthes scabra]|nr:hypothetical protein [Stylosanthes scabra]
MANIRKKKFTDPDPQVPNRPAQQHLTHCSHCLSTLNQGSTCKLQQTHLGAAVAARRLRPPSPLRCAAVVPVSISVLSRAGLLISRSTLTPLMAETALNATAAATPPVRVWRTAFLTLRDETLTPPPSSASTPQLLSNLIFSQSFTLLSAAPELPSHEVLSDILFLIELVAAISLNEEDSTHIYTQTSRLIHDICCRVSFDVNSSAVTGVVNGFSKILDLITGKDAGIRSGAEIIFAIECLQAFRCIISSSQRRWSQSEDTLLVKFLLDIIASSQAAFWLTPHSMGKDKIDMRLSIERSSCELQTVAFEMLSKAISRAGSSISVDIWRSMIKVVRKTMDFLALKSSFVEDNVMS